MASASTGRDGDGKRRGRDAGQGEATKRGHAPDDDSGLASHAEKVLSADSRAGGR